MFGEIGMQARSKVGTCLFILLAVGIFSRSVWASPQIQNSYGGITCVYVAAKALGHPIDFQSLTRPQYVGSEDGSSIDELVNAVRDNHLYAEAYHDVEIDELKAFGRPVILHSRSRLDSTSYDHWILYLGESDGFARVIDGADERRITLGELLARWDGDAVVISTTPITRRIVGARLWTLGLMGMSLIASAVHGKGRWRDWPTASNTKYAILLSLFSAAVLLLGSAITAVAYSRYASIGLLRNRDVVAMIEEANGDIFLEKFTYSELVEGMSAKEITLIDARHAADFDLRHIPGAINVPENSNEDALRKSVGEIPKMARIVVYCKNSSCPFSKSIARRLQAIGYQRVSVYVGGFQDWESHTK
jgi:rhodanese-related sulfurtransferase